MIFTYLPIIVKLKHLICGSLAYTPHLLIDEVFLLALKTCTNRV